MSQRLPRSVMRWTRHLLAAIRPSGLTVRLPRTGIADDSRNVNAALKSIRKELGINKVIKPIIGETDNNREKHESQSLDEAKVNLRNKMHKNIWLAMKRRDAPQFHQLEKEMRARDIEMDGVTYTLLMHAHLMFKGRNSACMDLIEEMKERGIHPALIRFNAVGTLVYPINIIQRILASCVEMETYNAKPLSANIVQMARAAWLTAVLITRRYPTHEHIVRMEEQIEEQEKQYLEEINSEV
ncbi:hypothetical protein BaOVIS_030060 [Babesia ovis]|uniref:Uncharacterized protein n=1 Tax=Babesia ovis TaxID=5869 RepID=A0A9W5WWJ6_BABOV|nr:hypothetical protein BaOVIS_030060 [Babesia ovis]